MKNNTIKSYIALLLLTVVSVSCENYLEESPDDRLELNSIDKAAKVVADAYSQASYAFTDMYTDLAGPVGTAVDGVIPNTGGNVISIQDMQIYTWSEVDAIFQDSPTYFWDQTYEAIAQTNEVLAVIDNLNGNEKKKNAIKGEALLSRAYNHFMLVNMFGLHYDENAATNLGIPYISEPETEFLPSYKRNTVAEVYDLVEKDLLEGLALINDDFFSGTKKYHFTKKAGQAFASRFYLWKKDYQNCKKYSDLFFDGAENIYVKNYDNIRGSNPDETGDNYNNPEDDSNVLLIQKFSNHQRTDSGYRLNFSDLQNLFSSVFGGFSQDERTSIGILGFGTDAVLIPRLREFFFRENLTSNSGLPYHIAVEFKGEEVLLNRAEANLFLGDQGAALADINILARARYRDNEFNNVSDIINFYSPLDPMTNLPILLSENDAILELILDERKKEFWDHGLRWFDIKRFNLPVTHIVPESEGGGVFNLTANDLRKAIQIPSDAQSFGLTPNPR